MATDAVNTTEDAEMADYDGDKVVTMMDVLQEQQDFEEDANAVLGASDDKNCTYVKGYIKRQALYACMTCCPDAKLDPTKRAGVCLACSLNCHENHELVELYTKRNFRCDCGNPKFNSHPCQYTPNKTDLNTDNIYNQNFSGLYCTCQRPYPDPEATFEDDMIQCIICEDWLHASHLDAVVPVNDQYSEMICKGCMEKNEFLHDYSKFAVNVESLDVDIIAINGNVSDDTLCNGSVAKEHVSNDKVENNLELEAAVPNGGDTDMLEDQAKSEKSEGQTHLDDNGEQEQTLESTKEINKDLEQKDTKNDTTKAEQNMETESKVSAFETDIEKDKQSTSDVKTDDKSDANKTEDQLLDDIRVLTSDNPSEEPKSSSIEDMAEKEGNSNISIKTEESPVEQSTKVNSVTKSSDIEVPDTSQDTSTKDDGAKTDAVMDAIDALLETTTEKSSENLSENKEAGDIVETQKSDDVETEKKQDEDTPKKIEISTTDSSEKTDIEMSEHKDINSEKKESNDTITIEPAANDKKPVTPTEKVLINGNNEALNETDNKTKPSDGTSKIEPSIDENKTTDATEVTNENKRKLSTEVIEQTSLKKAKLDSKCVRPKNVKKVHQGATFWPANFRQKLCTCGECISMYKDLHVLFLIDSEDTVSAYESLGKENIDAGASQYEKGLQALSSLDRIQQINALTEYNRMRDKLLDFLKSFKDRKEVVKEEDIKAFFAGMKPRRESDGVYFCR